MRQVAATKPAPDTGKEKQRKEPPEETLAVKQERDLQRKEILEDTLSTKHDLLGKEKLRLEILQDTFETTKDAGKKEAVAKQSVEKERSVAKLEEEIAGLQAKLAAMGESQARELEAAAQELTKKIEGLSAHDTEEAARAFKEALYVENRTSYDEFTSKFDALNAKRESIISDADSWKEKKDAAKLKETSARCDALQDEYIKLIDEFRPAYERAQKLQQYSGEIEGRLGEAKDVGNALFTAVLESDVRPVSHLLNQLQEIEKAATGLGAELEGLEGRKTQESLSALDANVFALREKLDRINDELKKAKKAAEVPPPPPPPPVEVKKEQISTPPPPAQVVQPPVQVPPPPPPALAERPPEPPKVKFEPSKPQPAQVVQPPPAIPIIVVPPTALIAETKPGKPKIAGREEKAVLPTKEFPGDVEAISLNTALFGDPKLQREETSHTKVVWTPGALQQLRDFTDMASGTKDERMGFIAGIMYKTPGGEEYFEVRDVVFPGRFDATSVNVKFGDTGLKEVMPLLNDLKYNYVLGGWVHSHPGHTAFFSETDISTHSKMFGGPHQFGVVIDPVNRQAAVLTVIPGEGKNPPRAVSVDACTFAPKEKRAAVAITTEVRAEKPKATKEWKFRKKKEPAPETVAPAISPPAEKPVAKPEEPKVPLKVKAKTAVVKGVKGAGKGMWWATKMGVGGTYVVAKMGVKEAGLRLKARKEVKRDIAAGFVIAANRKDRKRIKQVIETMPANAEGIAYTPEQFGADGRILAAAGIKSIKVTKPGVLHRRRYEVTHLWQGKELTRQATPDDIAETIKQAVPSTRRLKKLKRGQMRAGVAVQQPAIAQPPAITVTPENAKGLVAIGGANVELVVNALTAAKTEKEANAYSAALRGGGKWGGIQVALANTPNDAAADACFVALRDAGKLGEMERAGAATNNPRTRAMILVTLIDEGQAPHTETITFNELDTKVEGLVASITDGMGSKEFEGKLGDLKALLKELTVLSKSVKEGMPGEELTAAAKKYEELKERFERLKG